MEKTTYHCLKHRYREELIVPITAISNGVDFILGKDSEKRMLTADNVKCRVTKYKFVPICELENDIKRLYNKDAWDFLKTWYKAMPNMFSLEFLVLKLEKINAEIK